jgi:hypothetical protein
MKPSSPAQSGTAQVLTKQLDFVRILNMSVVLANEFKCQQNSNSVVALHVRARSQIFDKLKAARRSNAAHNAMTKGAIRNQLGPHMTCTPVFNGVPTTQKSP